MQTGGVHFNQAPPFLAVVVSLVFLLCLRLRGGGIGMMVLSVLGRRYSTLGVVFVRARH